MVGTDYQRKWIRKKPISICQNRKPKAACQRTKEDVHGCHANIQVSRSADITANCFYQQCEKTGPQHFTINKQNSTYNQRVEPANKWNTCVKSNQITKKGGNRCSSAPPNRIYNRTRQVVGNAYCKPSRPSSESNNTALRHKYRCSSAPLTKSPCTQRQTWSTTSPQFRTVGKDPQKAKTCSSKFSSTLLAKSWDFDQESFSDVMSFSDEVIDHQLDTLSISDSGSVVFRKCRPQSCVSFSRTSGWTKRSIICKTKHCCAKYIVNRPSSSPSLRQRVKPKLKESYVRRGNVPKYISFVDPMPVHPRPGTGTSSGYGSSGYSVVSEELLVSSGTQEEVVDSGEETGSELELKNRRGDWRLQRFGRSYGETRKKSGEDIEVASQEAVPSARSSVCNSAMSQQSGFDGNVLDGTTPVSNGNEAEKDMINDEILDTETERKGRGSSTDIERTDLNYEDLINDTNGLTDFSESELLENSLTAEGDDINEDGNDENSRNNGNVEIGGDGIVLGDSSSDADLEQKIKEFDYLLPNNDDIQDKENIPDNNLQVTFSDPLTTDQRSSTNVTDNEDGTNCGQPKSILKGRDSGKSKIYELEVEASIVKKMTSPIPETEKAPVKPLIGRRKADLRPQCRQDIVIADEHKQAPMRERGDSNEAEQDTSGEETPLDGEFVSAGGNQTRRSKPKKSIYGKRANLKAPSEKLQKRKGSYTEDTEETVTSAESALLMEQILEQEKRLKEGMKPWLKGRLALSQQNSRFEIPMDVRMLETMTPMEYLTKHCVISKRRKALYKHVFQKVDRNRDGAINFLELEKGLKDVHTGISDSEHLGNIMQMVNIAKESEFNLKQFSAVAAFSERISCKDQLPVELLNNLDGQKEVIESADFFALNWKLDGVNSNVSYCRTRAYFVAAPTRAVGNQEMVNPAVKKILDSL